MTEDGKTYPKPDRIKEGFARLSFAGRRKRRALGSAPEPPLQETHA
jgi:hypothetical protein